MSNTLENLKIVPRPVSDDQIRTLRTEAGAAGDTAMVATCDLALSGDEHARTECGAAIADARAAQEG